MASTDESMTCIKFHSESQGTDVLNELNQLRMDNKLCDLQVKIGENIFNCHSAVLLASSKYFKNEILKLSENRSAWKITIDITEICSKRIFELILDYIYTSNVLVPADLIELFLNESKILEIDSLKPAMEEAFSADVINIDNATALSLLSFKMNITSLKEFCVSFVCKHFQEIIARKDFLEITDEILMELIKRDELIASEEIILDAVLLWAEYWPSERCNKLVTILKVLRLGLLPETKAAKLMRHHLIRINREALDFVADLSEYFLSGKQTVPPFEVSVKRRIQSKVTENEKGTAKIILVGGYKNVYLSQNVYLSHKVLALDLEDKTLESLPDLPEPVKYSRAEVIDNKLYVHVVGAISCTDTNSTFCFDPVTKEWCKKSCMNNARFNHGLVSINTKLFAIGGMDRIGFALKSVECYDSVENEWHSLSDSPEPLSHMGACPSSNGSFIYIFGGSWRGTGKSNRIYEYNVFTDTWNSGGTLPTTCSNAAAVCIKDRIFVFDNTEVLEYFPDQKSVVHRKEITNAQRRCQVVTDNNMVYYLGDTSTTVNAYDVDNNEWHKFCDIDCKTANYAAAILKF